MKYNLVFSALSVKKALDVYLEIWYSCKTEEYCSFEEIRTRLHLGKSTCRRITNRLARVGLITSLIDSRQEDKRKRVYVVSSGYFANTLENLLKA